MLQKKEYEVALVGALQRENNKDTALQALAAENQAVLRLVIAILRFQLDILLLTFDKNE